MDIVIQSGLFHDGSSNEEIEYIESLYPNKKFYVHMVLPGEAHITVYEGDAK